MEQNRIHDMYREGGKKAKTFIEVELEITDHSEPFEFRVNSRDLVSSEQILKIAPKFKYQFGFGSENLFATLENCIGYRFFDRQEVRAKDKEILKGSRRNVSPDHYFAVKATKQNLRINCQNKLIKDLARNVSEDRKRFSIDFYHQQLENMLYTLNETEKSKDRLLIINRFERVHTVPKDSILLRGEQ